MIKKKINIAIIGKGPWGKKIEKNIICNKEKINLIYKAGRDWNKFKKKIIDGIIVATPPATHFKIVYYFIKKKIPVFVEKPFCLNENEVLKLKQESEKNKSLIFVNYIHLYSKSWNFLKKKLVNLGKIKKIESKGGNIGPFRINNPCLWDYGSHDLSMLFDIVKEPFLESKIKIIKKEKINNSIGYLYKINFRFKKLVSSILIGNILEKKTRIFKIFCEKGVIIYDDTKKFTIIEKINNRKKKYKFDNNKNIEDSLNNFIQCIKKKRGRHKSLFISLKISRAIEDLEKRTQLT